MQQSLDIRKNGPMRTTFAPIPCKRRCLRPTFHSSCQRLNSKKVLAEPACKSDGHLLDQSGLGSYKIIMSTVTLIITRMNEEK